MKVLYAAYRHDPLILDEGSGSDYHYHKAFVRAGLDVSILGPFKNLRESFLERIVRYRIHSLFTNKRYAKFPLTNTWSVSQSLNEAERYHKPDVIFTMFPLFLTYYQGVAPCVYRLDTSFLGWQRSYPEFSRLAMIISRWQERKAFDKAHRIVTQSDWTQSILVEDYGIDKSKIDVFPNPAALPDSAIPKTINVRIEKDLTSPLRLLLVGRDYYRKGVDTAIEILRGLLAQGIPAELTICGVGGNAQPNVRFVGPYKKSEPIDLLRYVTLYREAHFLLHPVVFEAAGIVPSEAAAFFTPTITNDTGGLATTVRDGKSGVVLPKGSQPAEYVKAIVDLISNPEQYYTLCYSARYRYDQELNWNVAGRRVVAILEQVVHENPRLAP